LCRSGAKFPVDGKAVSKDLVSLFVRWELNATRRCHNEEPCLDLAWLKRLPMTRNAQMFILHVALLSTTTAQSVSSDHTGMIQATFVASNGHLIELNIRTGTLETPRSRGTGLQDCSDKFQVCLTDHHGFAFAYFRKCNDAGFGYYKRLRFPPKVVSVLHNSDLWMVFDAAPKYLFHYPYSRASSGSILGRRPHSIFEVFSMIGILRWLVWMRRNIALPVLKPLLRAASDSFYRQRMRLARRTYFRTGCVLTTVLMLRSSSLSSA